MNSMLSTSLAASLLSLILSAMREGFLRFVYCSFPSGPFAMRVLAPGCFRQIPISPTVPVFGIAKPALTSREWVIP